MQIDISTPTARRQNRFAAALCVLALAAAPALAQNVLPRPAGPFAVALLTYTGLFIAAEVSLWSRQDFSRRVQTS